MLRSILLPLTVIIVVSTITMYVLLGGKQLQVEETKLPLYHAEITVPFNEDEMKTYVASADAKIRHIEARVKWIETRRDCVIRLKAAHASESLISKACDIP